MWVVSKDTKPTAGSYPESGPFNIFIDYFRVVKILNPVETKANLKNLLCQFRTAQ
jgi:hypothetical protein